MGRQRLPDQICHAADFEATQDFQPLYENPLDVSGELLHRFVEVTLLDPVGRFVAPDEPILEPLPEVVAIHPLQTDLDSLRIAIIGEGWIEREWFDRKNIPGPLTGWFTEGRPFLLAPFGGQICVRDNGHIG